MRHALVASVAALPLLCPLAHVHAAPITFGYIGSFQTFSVLTTGVYDIVAFGAQGGLGSSSGGLGAEVGADFLLTQGQALTLAVGGQGGNGVGYLAHGGGGGGSFVVLGSTALVIAGGGGGAGVGSVADGAAGGSGQAGTAGGASNASVSGKGGTSGSGGTSGDGILGGGGGGGFNGDGSSNFYGNGGFGGAGYPSLAGGAIAFPGFLDFGGFGGGGGGSEGGGGGGGYSGGEGGAGISAPRTAVVTTGGGGGGSFVAASALTNADLIDLAGGQGSNNFSDDGSITINLVSATSPTAVPEPGALAILALPLSVVSLLITWARKHN